MAVTLLTVAPSAMASCSTRPPVADVVRGQQHGMVLPTWDQDGYEQPDTDPALRAIAGVGARWVQIVPTWYQPTRTADQISPDEGTPSDRGVRNAISLAHERGLKVLLKPHVDPLDKTDRHQISPSNPATWFASYSTFITHYAEIAADLGVEEFAVGTELNGVSGDRARWLRVIESVRERYSGVLVYAAGTDYATVPFWDALDLVGIDVYRPLATGPTTDAGTLMRGWEPYRAELAAFAARVGRRILFTEAGFASQRGTVTAPWDWTLSREPAQAEQAAGYRSLLETFSDQPWWAGVYWWVWAVLKGEPHESLGFTVRGKTAEAVVREWWGTERAP